MSRTKSANFEENIRSLLAVALTKPAGVSADLSPDFSLVSLQENSLDFSINPPENLRAMLKSDEKPANFKSLLRKALKNNENLEFSPQERRKVWLFAGFLPDNARENYEKLLFASNSSEYPDYFFKMIELDVFRTWIGPDLQEPQKNALIKQLRNILRAYAVRNPYIGYCQGFNFIVAEFLGLGFAEEEVFWLLVFVLEVMLPLDFYTSMLGILVDQKLFLEILKLEFPEIVDKFHEFSLDCSFFTLQWFVCLFSGACNKIVFEIIWDHLFAFGAVYLLRSGVALLELTREKWLKSQDFPELLLKLEESVKNFSDTRLFQETLQSKYMSKKLICRISEDLRASFKQNLRQKNKKMRQKSRDSRSSQRLMACDEKSPLCWDILEKNRVKKRAVSFFVFREAQKPAICAQYFEDRGKVIEKNGSLLEKSASFKEKGNLDLLQELVIGRHHHICTGKYVKTKRNGTVSQRKEIEMQEMQGEKKKDAVFFVEKSQKVKSFEHFHEKKVGFFESFAQKIGNIFNLLCLRDPDNTKIGNAKGVLPVESRKLAIIDYSSEFNLSFLNNNATNAYKEGLFLGREEKIRENEAIFKELEIKLEEFEKFEHLQEKSRTLSFNSSFRNRNTQKFN